MRVYEGVFGMILADFYVSSRSHGMPRYLTMRAVIDEQPIERSMHAKQRHVLRLRLHHTLPFHQLPDFPFVMPAEILAYGFHESRQLAHVFATFSHEMAILSHNSFQVCIE